MSMIDKITARNRQMEEPALGQAFPMRPQIRSSQGARGAIEDERNHEEDEKDAESDLRSTRGHPFEGGEAHDGGNERDDQKGNGPA